MIHESNYAIHDMQPLPFCKHPLGVTGNDIYRSLGVINIVCAQVECGWPILHRLALALLHICIFLSHKLWLRTCSPHSYREDVLFLSLGCHMQQSGYPVRYKLSIGNTGIITIIPVTIIALVIHVLQQSLNQYRGRTDDEETTQMEKMILVVQCSKIMEVCMLSNIIAVSVWVRQKY